ncbi:MAG: DUF177 domain-containing protein [Microbacteriaceae bacterium]|nr:DUF177 domain-containing protein [Microbacteriaceae bacterium]MCI1207177.1 DUF177 domain-containing protein [Microbacteriaceae bacterium]
MISDTVLNVRDLLHRPGEERTVPLAIELGEDLGTGIAQVVEGTVLRGEAHLESLHDGILVTASLQYQVQAECARCLKPFTWDEEVEFQELFEYSRKDASGPEAEDETLYVLDDSVDLEQPVRDAVVLKLPFRPLCEAYGAGPCEASGIVDVETQSRLDPRWAALEALRTQQASRNER